MKIFKKVLYLFKGREKQNFVILFVLLIIGGVFEAFSIALIFPFIGIVTQPDFFAKHSNSTLFRKIGDLIGPVADQTFVLGLLLLAVFIMKFLFILWVTHKKYKIIYTNQVNIGVRLLSGYVARNFSFFSKTNSAAMLRNMTADISNIANNVVVNTITLISEGVIILSLVSVIIFMKPGVVLVSMFAIALIVYIVYSFVKKALYTEGAKVRTLIETMLLAINHSIGAIKDLKIIGKEDYFVYDYAETGKEYSKRSAKLMTVTQLPRLVIELVLALGVVILFGVITRINGFNIQSALPSIALIGTVVVRMLPSVNRIMASMNGLRHHQDALENISRELEEGEICLAKKKKIHREYTFENRIELKNIHFAYDGEENDVLKGVNLTVNKGEVIGIVGESGSGKSTLVELILGLREIRKGNYLIDGKEATVSPGLNGLMGYVPQDIFLVDSSVKENIEFGRRANEESFIDEIIKMVVLDQFIKNQKKGLELIVGERGSRISGGQRQRIGIARAIYGKPQVIVFDEATSALDRETENSLIKSIMNLRGQNTLILVSHNIETLKDCDKIIKIEKGKISFTGDYNAYLLNRNEVNITG